MKYSSMKEIDGLVKQCLKAHWQFRRGGKHGRLTSPDGQRCISVPCTPSDKRAFLNFRRDVRQAGGAGMIL